MAYNYGLFPIKTQKVTSSGSSAATTDGVLAHTQYVRLVAGEESATEDEDNQVTSIDNATTCSQTLIELVQRHVQR